jgi:hypothetical protein
MRRVVFMKVNRRRLRIGIGYSCRVDDDPASVAGYDCILPSILALILLVT